jgi:hypothetical protein
MKAASSTKATGEETAGASSTIIAGIIITTATTTGIRATSITNMRSTNTGATR